MYIIGNFENECAVLWKFNIGNHRTFEQVIPSIFVVHSKFQESL